MHFTTFSQELKPDKVFIDGKDTLFCWTFAKAKLLAQEISHSYYADELMLEFEQRQDLTDSLLKYEKHKNTILLKEKENYDQIIGNKNKQEKLNDHILAMQTEEIKRLKRTCFLTSAAAVVFGIAAILK
jgi:hypothetical protein